MKIFNEKITLLVLTVIAFCVAGLMYYFGVDHTENSLSNKNIKQTLTITKIFPLPTIYDQKKNYFWSLTCFNKNFYVNAIRDGRYSIDVLDSNGVFLKSFAQNNLVKGAFQLDSDGIYSPEIDYSNKIYSLLERNFNDSILHYYNFDKQILENLKIGSQTYVVKFGDTNNTKYSYVDEYDIINFKTGFTKKMKVILKDSAFYLQRYGFFVKGNRGINFKIGRESSIFFAFDDSGRVLYQAETVDKLPPLEIVKSPDGGIRPIPNASKLKNYNGMVLKDKLLIASARKENSQWNYTVDVYAQDSGKYLFSWKVPKANDEIPMDLCLANYHQFIVSYKTVIGYVNFPDSLL